MLVTAVLVLSALSLLLLIAVFALSMHLQARISEVRSFRDLYDERGETLGLVQAYVFMKYKEHVPTTLKLISQAIDLENNLSAHKKAGNVL